MVILRISCDGLKNFNNVDGIYAALTVTLRQLKHSMLISLVEMHGPEDESTMNIPSVSNYLATTRHGLAVQKTLFFSTG